MWIYFALGASVLWGLTYTLTEQIYKKISISTFFAIASFVMLVVTLLISYFSNNLHSDLQSIASSKKLFMLVAFGIIAIVGAEYLIAVSISAQNATLAGLIEISYPIFIAIFSYIFFKENQASVSTIAGAILIFSGIFVIYHFNK